MRVTVLGSGSRGNAMLVEAGQTRLLLDAGFSARELDRRLRAVGVGAETLSALWITHEHRDHAAGAGTFARRYDLPVFLTAGVARTCAWLEGWRRVHVYRPARPVAIGDLEVEPFLTAHDASDPVAVAITERSTGHRVGCATDLGAPTAGVRHALRSCHVLVLEANHDEILLREGSYPASVKARIAGPRGHLSNRAAAELALELYHPALAAVVLAHMSEECNTEHLARQAVAAALRRVGYRGLLLAARQDEPVGPIEVGEALRRIAGPQLTLW